jgi:hypothetical protein
VFQETNGQEPYLCPAKAFARRTIHMSENHCSPKDYLLTYYIDKHTCGNVTSEYISKSIKLAKSMLNYPTTKGILIQCINTHSLRSGGANALTLAGYSDTQIQNMGR